MEPWPRFHSLAPSEDSGLSLLSLGHPPLGGEIRIDLKELERILAGKSKLKARLSKLQYKGLLSDFDGPRWWREAIELFLWKITDGIRRTTRRSLQLWKNSLESHCKAR